MDVFFDLQNKLVSDPVFIAKVGNVMDAINKAEAAGNKLETSKYMLKLLDMCEYNTSLLVPFMFPKYPVNKPMTLWTRPHAMAMLSYLPNATITVCTGRQTGKCTTGDTKVNCRVGGKERDMTIADIFNISKNHEIKKQGTKQHRR